MKCPNCNETLVMADRAGVEIDYCPNCRGVWLDRGELDKIIQRSIEYGQPSPSSRPQHLHEKDFRHNDDYYKSEQYKKKKRDSFLGDLFDF